METVDVGADRVGPSGNLRFGGSGSPVVHGRRVGVNTKAHGSRVSAGSEIAERQRGVGDEAVGIPFVSCVVECVPVVPDQ